MKFASLQAFAEARKNIFQKPLTFIPSSVNILDVPRGSAAWRGSIAQLGEHLPYKQRVTGSSPVVPTITWPGSSVGLECQPVTLEVEGSSPFRVAIPALVAQSVEHVTENHSVGGSIPPQGTFQCGSSSVGRAPPCQGGGRESEPRLPLHFLGRHSQVVRRRSAKPLCSGPNPDGASLPRPARAGFFCVPASANRFSPLLFTLEIME